MRATRAQARGNELSRVVGSINILGRVSYVYIK